jgi:hypothetical protein
MMDLMMGLPPIHPAAATSSDVVFWMLIGFLVVVFLAVTALWIVGSRRIAQRQSEVKEAEWRYEAFPQPEGKEQTPVHSAGDELLLKR